jgi:hypothetical protein
MLVTLTIQHSVSGQTTVCSTTHLGTSQDLGPLLLLLVLLVLVLLLLLLLLLLLGLPSICSQLQGLILPPEDVTLLLQPGNVPLFLQDQQQQSRHMPDVRSNSESRGQVVTCGEAQEQLLHWQTDRLPIRQTGRLWQGKLADRQGKLTGCQGKGVLHMQGGMSIKAGVAPC